MANGLPTDRGAADPGWHQTDWAEPGSFPTYVGVVAVGDFTVTDRTDASGLRIINAVPRKDAPKLTRRLAN